MRLFLIVSAVAVAVGAGLLSLGSATSARAALVVPPAHTPAPTQKGVQKLVVAGGCFWGIEAVFEHVHGVLGAVSGYSGGAAQDAHYETVSGGKTGHAEAVEITYDADQVSLPQLLQVYFSVAHDPTQLNRQGPDSGTQYRSEIFAPDQAVADFARAYIAELDAAKVFSAPVVTKVAVLDAFYPAEGYHQDFAARNPDYPYIVYNDAPKVAALKAEFPDLYRAPIGSGGQ